MGFPKSAHWTRAGAIALAAVIAPAAQAVSAEQSFAIIFNNTKNDGGFNEAALNAITALKGERSLIVREAVTGSPEETVTAMTRYAQAGVSDIMVISFVNTEPLTQVAPEWPQTRFTIIDGVVEQPNVRAVLFREEEAGFLAGAAAGFATKSNTLGFIGAIPIPPIDKFGCGFVQGAKAANPNVQVIWRYIGDTPRAFRDRAGAVAKAEELVAAGADVIFPAAGFPGADAMKAAAEKGALSIGVDSNRNGLIPGKVLTSAVKRVDVAARQSWADAADGAWSGGVKRLGLAEGGVDWAVDEHNAALVAPFREKVEALKAEIVSGARVIEDYATRADCKPN